QVDPEDAAGSEVATARRAAAREAEEEAGLVVDPEDLVTFSHWVPPAVAPKRFSTWFFLAPAPTVHDVLVDGSEIHAHEWVRPPDAIARRDGGELELAAPTSVTLWRVWTAADGAAALAGGRSRETGL